MSSIPFQTLSSHFEVPSEVASFARSKTQQQRTAEPEFGQEPTLPSAPAANEAFVGLPDANTSIPPDTMGAVSKTHVLTTLNTQVLVQDRKGNTVAPAVTLNAWWDSALSTSGLSVFDPRVAYDPFNDRFLFAAVADRSSNSKLLFAASSSGDLSTATWNALQYTVDFANQLWADFPSVGFSGDKFVITFLRFSISGGGTPDTQALVVNKSELYAGIAPTTQTLTFADFGLGVCAPAVTLDAGANDVQLVINWNGSSGGDGYYRQYKITGPAGAASLTSVGFPFLSGVTWGSGGVNGPQNTTSEPSAPGLDMNDSRVLSVVQRNSSLHFCNAVFLDASGGASGTLTHVVVQWVIANLSATVTANGRFAGDATSMQGVPSLAVNSVGDMLIGYTAFTSAGFPSCAYRLRKADTGAFDSELVYSTGLDVYWKTFSGSSNRWGDYSQTQVDPTDDTSFWTIQERSVTKVGSGNNSGRWSTQWARVTPNNGAVASEEVDNFGNASAPDGDFPGTRTFGGASVTVSGNEVCLNSAADNSLPISYAFDSPASFANSDYIRVVADTTGASSATANVTATVALTYSADGTVWTATQPGLFLNQSLTLLFPMALFTQTSGTATIATTWNSVSTLQVSLAKTASATMCVQSVAGADPHIVCLDGSRTELYEPGTHVMLAHAHDRFPFRFDVVIAAVDHGPARPPEDYIKSGTIVDHAGQKFTLEFVGTPGAGLDGFVRVVHPSGEREEGETVELRGFALGEECSVDIQLEAAHRTVGAKLVSNGGRAPEGGLRGVLAGGGGASFLEPGTAVQRFVASATVCASGNPHIIQFDGSRQPTVDSPDLALFEWQGVRVSAATTADFVRDLSVSTNGRVVADWRGVWQGGSPRELTLDLPQNGGKLLVRAPGNGTASLALTSRAPLVGGDGPTTETATGALVEKEDDGQQSCHHPVFSQQPHARDLSLYARVVEPWLSSSALLA